HNHQRDTWLLPEKKTGLLSESRFALKNFSFKVLLNPGPCIHYIWSPTVRRT
ncbi:unnamed protein product, partial [Staurois parvus]